MAYTQELIDKAKREDKLLHCHYADLWFTPKELETLQNNGRFRWDETNFHLVSKKDSISKLQKEKEDLTKKIQEINRIIDRIIYHGRKIIF